MKTLVLGSLLLISAAVMAQPNINGHVITHNRTTIFCDASSGVKARKF